MTGWPRTYRPRGLVQPVLFGVALAALATARAVVHVLERARDRAEADDARSQP